MFVVYNLGTNDLLLGEILVKVNDNAYHVVRFHRQCHNSTLQVDDYNIQTLHPSGKMQISYYVNKYAYITIMINCVSSSSLSAL